MSKFSPYGDLSLTRGPRTTLTFMKFATFDIPLYKICGGGSLWYTEQFLRIQWPKKPTWYDLRMRINLAAGVDNIGGLRGGVKKYLTPIFFKL